jgi:hypothetical protein
VLRVAGDELQIYQTFIANLLTSKTAATSEKFTACRRRETELSGFNPVNGMARRLLMNIGRGICRARGKRRSPMAHAATTRLQEPLPRGTAMLSNIALSLFLWNITFRIAGLLLAA